MKAYLAAFLVCALGPASAQTRGESRGTPRVAGSEVTIGGQIRRVVKHSVEGQAEVHLIVIGKERDVEVHIAPAYYLAWHQFQLHPGDRVEMVARRAAGEPHYVAREITHGVRTLALRDASYRPLWKKGQK
jgi:hypothetical protein